MGTRFVRIDSESGGDTVHLLGRDARGRLFYGADGMMTGFMMAGNRPPIGWQGSSIPDAHKAAAYETFFAYCGSYETISNQVIHHVDFASVPSMTGVDLVRDVAFERGQLILSTIG